MPETEDCLADLLALAAGEEARALEGIEEPVSRYLLAVGADRAEQADALFRLIAAFIGRVPPARVGEAMIERLVELRGELLTDAPTVTREREDTTVRGLIRRLGSQESGGAHVTPAQIRLILRALRFYLDAGPGA